MRVLHLGSGNLYGGVERFLVTLARLRERVPRMQPSFALCFEGRLARELRETGVPVELLGAVRLSRPWTLHRARRALTGCLERLRPDVVVSHSSWTQVVGGPILRRAGVPLVAFLHAPFHGRHWLERWARLATPRALLCNSRFTAEESRAAWPDTPRVVTYLPAEAVERVAAPQARTRARAELGVRPEEVVILQLSRMERLKGHRLHLGALSRMRARQPWCALFVGGAQRPEERRYATELQAAALQLGLAGQVRFLGERADTQQLLEAADVYCQPNTAPESFGLAFIEAMSAGLPVVTSAMGGALEIIDDSSGLLTVPREEAVAQALGRLVEDASMRAEMGRAARLRARRLCEPSARLEGLARALEGTTFGRLEEAA